MNPEWKVYQCRFFPCGILFSQCLRWGNGFRLVFRGFTQIIPQSFNLSMVYLPFNLCNGVRVAFWPGPLEYSH